MRTASSQSRWTSTWVATIGEMAIVIEDNFEKALSAEVDRIQKTAAELSQVFRELD